MCVSWFGVCVGRHVCASRTWWLKFPIAQKSVSSYVGLDALISSYFEEHLKLKGFF